jgi:hypothetical protein
MGSKASTRGTNKGKDTMTPARWAYLKGLRVTKRMFWISTKLQEVTNAVTKVVSTIVVRAGGTYKKPRIEVK